MTGINQLLLLLLCLTMYAAFKVPNLAKAPPRTSTSPWVNKIPSRATTISSFAFHMSFVQDEMRPYAIKYHSRDQTAQGGLPAQVPFTKWNPTRQDYLHFLVDSLAVYDLIECAVAAYPVLQQIRVSELERTTALQKDITWLRQFDPALTLPPIGAAGSSYTSFLQKLLDGNDLPGLVCHYYNQYFALSAGGLRIGSYLSGKLLAGHKLALYTFEGIDSVPELHSGGDVCSRVRKVSAGGTNDGVGVSAQDEHGQHTGVDAHHIPGHTSSHIHHSTLLHPSTTTSVPNIPTTTTTTTTTTSTSTSPGITTSAAATPTTTTSTATSTSTSTTSDSAHLDALKDQLRQKIDVLAASWSPEKRQRCCEETENCFKYGNKMLKYLHGSTGGVSS